MASVILPVMATPVSPATASTARAKAISAGPDCKTSFDPYSYTEAQDAACGETVFPRRAVAHVAGGGSTVQYDVNGYTVTMVSPPAGFHPATATSAQLTEYGFPPRPTSSVRLASWMKAMTHWKRAVAPPPFLVETHTSADTEYATNWAGYAVTGQQGQSDFSIVQASWAEPTIYSSVCSSTAESTWVGIGGYSVPDGESSQVVGQIGTAVGEAGVAAHQAWWEIFPDNYVVPVNLTTNAGDGIDAQVYYSSSTGYNFWLEDESTYVSTPGIAIDDTDGSPWTAEAIIERPSDNGVLADLSNFGTMTFFGSWAGNANGEYSFDQFSAGPASEWRHGVHMNDSSEPAPDMADPSGISANGYFTITQHSCI